MKARKRKKRGRRTMLTRQMQQLVQLRDDRYMPVWDDVDMPDFARALRTQGVTPINRWLAHMVDIVDLIAVAYEETEDVSLHGPLGERRTRVSMRLSDGRDRTEKWTVSGWYQCNHKLRLALANLRCPHCDTPIRYRQDATMRCPGCGAIGEAYDWQLYSDVLSRTHNARQAWTHLKALREGRLREGRGETWWYREPSPQDTREAPRLDEVTGPSWQPAELELPIRIDPYGRLSAQDREASLSEDDPERLAQRVRSLGRGAGAMLMPKCDNCRHCVGVLDHQWKDSAQLELHCAWPLQAADMAVLKPDWSLGEKAFQYQYDLSDIIGGSLTNLENSARRPGARLLQPGELQLSPVCGHWALAERDWRDRPIQGETHPTLRMILATGQIMANTQRMANVVRGEWQEPEVARDRLLAAIREAPQAAVHLHQRLSMRHAKSRQAVLSLLERAFPPEWRLQSALSDHLDALGFIEASDKAILWLQRRLVEGARAELEDKRSWASG